MPRLPRPQHPTNSGGGRGRGSEQRVWVLRDGEPVAIVLTIGVSDGRMTEVIGGELEPGMQVITDMAAVTKK